MFGLGIWELIIILSIVVMLFGAKRLPMIGEGLGSMITNFKKATKTNELEEKKEESVLVEGSSKEKEGV
ncbi:MAG: Sec-independent protein translocase subunit TatA/TatB, partial [bacterium]